MLNETYDSIIIGAGAAGLMAAMEMALAGKKIAIIEARNRIGGRIHTLQNPDFDLPVELGAEFIHGKLEPTMHLLKMADVGSYEVSGDLFQHTNGIIQKQDDFIEDDDQLNRHFNKLDNDISVLSFIEKYLQDDASKETGISLKNYVEGYYAADTTRASTFALHDELNSADKQQNRVDGSYAELPVYLYNQCVKLGVKFFLSNPVNEIKWQHNSVRVITMNGKFNSLKVLVTVPIGVLQMGKIRFTPKLPHKIDAAKQLGYGNVIKMIFQFKIPFWKNREKTQGQNLDKMSFIFSTAPIPTWWTYYPKDVAMITGWAGGPYADKLKDLNKQSLLQTALLSLEQIFDVSPSWLLQNLTGWHTFDWSNDPYSCGAYSFDVINGNKLKKILSAPVNDTIYFAGEGLINGPEIGTVNAALVSGSDTAREMIKNFKKST